MRALRGRGLDWLRGDVVAVVLVAATALAGRFLPVVLAGGLPLNDGGLFYRMSLDLRANGFVPPPTTSYNGAGIPFIYPPLGIYLPAILADVSPWSLTTIVTWLPALLSALAVPALYVLARELLGSRFRALVAAAAFAVLPPAYTWSIEGGGIPRALGALFALLALAAAVRYLRAGRTAPLMTASLFGGLAVMSHPIAALFVVLSVGVVGLAERGARRSIAVVAGIAFASMPWWGPVMLWWGPARLLSAGTLDGPVVAVLSAFGAVTALAAGEMGLPLVASAGVLGFLLAMKRREPLLPAWLLVTLFTEERLGVMYAMVPLSIAAAVGVVDVVLPGIARIEIPEGLATRLMPTQVWSSIPVRDGLLVAIAACTLVGFIVAIAPSSPDHAVSPEIRQAMDWVRSSTPVDARFAVVSGDSEGQEGTQEWFPALAERVGEATPQGREWLGDGAWRAATLDDQNLQACAQETSDCLVSWAGGRGSAPDYVFIPKGHLQGPDSLADCCAPLRLSIAASSRFAVVYDGAGATIARWLG